MDVAVGEDVSDGSLVIVYVFVFVGVAESDSDTDLDTLLDSD